MSTRAKSRMSVSFHPADLTTTTNTIFEEGDSTDSVSKQLESGPVYGQDDYQYQQAELIAKLRQRIDDLETDADSSVPLADHQRVQQEWQTSEDLLRGSQRDNEQKHETIEQYKVYVKVCHCNDISTRITYKQELERIIGDVLGSDWKVDHQVRPPLSQSTCFSASTPLPKPSMAALRRSVSIMPSAKRSSKVATRHLSASTFGSLYTQGPFAFENKDMPEMDDTPTGAMRKLLGSSSRPHHLVKTERAVSATKSLTLHAQTSSPYKPTATHPAIPVEQAPHAQPSVTLPQLDAEHIRALLQLLAVRSGANGKAKAPDDTVLLQTLERIEKAEKAAEAREKRLRTMLEEARAASRKSSNVS